jgi:hypothetical protein
MHEPIWEGMEGYLAGKPDSNFTRHLEACPECRDIVVAMESQSMLVRSLKAPADTEPGPGFYARVMDRIETQRSASIWSVFLEPLFAKRLIYSTAVLTALLGVFLFTSPKEDMTASSVPEQIFAEEAPPPAQLVDQEQDRNTVFVQFATFTE